VKPWNFDPTKWIIWILSKLGLTRNLRRVPVEKIRLVQQLNTSGTKPRNIEDGANNGHRGSRAIPVIAAPYY
jgi:hypothetical protein